MWNFPRCSSLFAFLAVSISRFWALSDSLHVCHEVQQDVYTFPAGDFGERTKQNKNK